MSGRYTSFAVELEGALNVAQQLSDIPGRILQAQKRALGTMRRRLATEAKRDIQAEYNLKAGRIAEGLSVRDTADGVALIGRARGINAIQFGATWSRRMKGARFTLKRGGDRSGHDGSFIATGKSGNRLVFERTGKARLPLQAVYGPSVGQMLKHGRRPERLAEFAIRVLESEQRRLLGTR
jgi:hypothetical protein